MTHDEIKADLSSFALGALDSEDQRAVETHLAAGCAECERELLTWREVVGVMALDSGDAAAPDLKPSLLGRVRQPRQAAKVIVLPRWLVVPLAAAAMVILALSVVREVRFREGFTRQQERIAALTGELAGAQDELQRLRIELVSREHDADELRTALAAAREALAVIQTPGLQFVRLDKTEDAPPAEGHMLMNARTGQALFYAFDLPPVPSDKAYELWWITEKEGPVNAGLFLPDQQGLGRVEAAVPGDFGAIQAAAVTIEPAAGVPKPTGPMVLLGKL
jgi:hypothetical protein